MNLVIIIPAYNEAINICRLINLIKKKITCKIILIDDSINNDTEKIIKNIKGCHYFRRYKKLGRGSAVLYGLKNALKFKEADLFIEMDADFSHSPLELRRNVNFFLKNNLDLLISSRYLKGSKIINWPISRRIFSYLSNLLARSILRIPVTDYTNGFRIYSRRAAKVITRKCGKIGDGFIILSEILVVINNQKFKISEIKSKFSNRIRGESSINIRLIIESFIGLIRLYFK